MLPSEKENWILKLDENFVSTPGIVLTPIYEEIEDEDSKEGVEFNLYLIAIFVPICVILILLCLVCLIKKFRKKKEAVIENNPYYAQDEEYYDEHDNRIEDRNDYYNQYIS